MQANREFPLEKQGNLIQEQGITRQSSELADLPLNFHPAAVRASANVTPFGAVSVPA
jgi:hypothetical protein